VWRNKEIKVFLLFDREKMNQILFYILIFLLSFQLVASTPVFGTSKPQQEVQHTPTMKAILSQGEFLLERTNLPLVIIARLAEPGLTIIDKEAIERLTEERFNILVRPLSNLHTG
jgi:hypothetical protein